MKTSRILLALGLSVALAAPTTAFAIGDGSIMQKMMDRADEARAMIKMPAMKMSMPDMKMMMSADDAEMAAKCFFHWTDACEEAFGPRK